MALSNRTKPATSSELERVSNSAFGEAGATINEGYRSRDNRNIEPVQPARRFVVTKSPGATLTNRMRLEIACRMLGERKAFTIPECPKYNPLPSFKHLQRLFGGSDLEKGILTRRLAVRGRTSSGDGAGGVCGNYRVVMIEGRNFGVHRIIWKLHHGRDPQGQIDHINGNGLDNSISNLRDVTPTVNARNKHVVRSNTGHIGVSFCKQTNRYHADIGLGGRVLHVGRFVRLECAVAARQCAEKWLYGPLPKFISEAA